MWLHSVCHFSFPLSKVFLLFSGGARLDKSDALHARFHSLPGFLCYFVLTSQLTIFLAPPSVLPTLPEISTSHWIFITPLLRLLTTLSLLDHSPLTPVSLYMIPLYFFWPPLNFLPNDSLFFSYDFFFFRLRTLYMCCGRCLYMCVSPFLSWQTSLLVLCMPVAVYYLIYSSDVS